MNLIELQLDDPGKTLLGESKYDTLYFDSREALQHWLRNALPPGAKWRLRGETTWREAAEVSDD